jgi:glycosyltransferase involved in cell wall biosynthesis
MPLENELAIVVPAYKGAFLDETLFSICNQTCKQFTLIIGDDASPENLYKIVQKYLGKLNIVYKRFENNLGNENLAGHWKRCIDLAKNAEWLWLFSDDDIMGVNCVESFFNFIRNNDNLNLVHFDLNIINQYGLILKKSPPFPSLLRVSDFFFLRVKNIINSTAVEFIFRKSKFDALGGFKNYDLAWCTDDALWMELGCINGIATIPDIRVNWRNSGVNISSLEDKTTILKKLQSSICYMQWARSFFFQKDLADKASAIDKFKWVSYLIFSSSFFTLSEKIIYRKLILKQLNLSGINLLSFTFLSYIHIKSWASKISTALK